MTTDTLNPNWAGEHAEPIDPAAIRFKAARGPTDRCNGCIFIGQRNAVCHQASAIAVQNGQLDCDVPWPEGGAVIYVLDKADARQLNLLSEPVAGATAAGSDQNT